MEINGINLPLLRNAAFIQFMKDCLSIVQYNDTAAQNVSAQHLALQQSLSAIETIYATDQGSDITPQIEAADARRDKAINGITQYLEAMKYHYDPTKALFASQLADNLRLYGTGLARISYQAETAAIDNIVNDWSTDPQLSAAISVLSLTDWRNELNTANQQFNNLYLNRTRELATANPYTIKNLRLEATSKYYTLRDMLSAYATINNNANPWGKSVAELNALIEQYNNLLNSNNNPAEQDSSTPPPSPTQG